MTLLREGNLDFEGVELMQRLLVWGLKVNSERSDTGVYNRH